MDFWIAACLWLSSCCMLPFITKMSVWALRLKTGRMTQIAREGVGRGIDSVEGARCEGTRKSRKSVSRWDKGSQEVIAFARSRRPLPEVTSINVEAFVPFMVFIGSWLYRHTKVELKCPGSWFPSCAHSFYKGGTLQGWLDATWHCVVLHRRVWDSDGKITSNTCQNCWIDLKYGCSCHLDEETPKMASSI